MDRASVSRGAFPVALLFLAVGLLCVLHHEMWRDELEVWLIARDSATLPDLVHHCATQAHPLLWYVLAWGLARVTESPLALQWLSLLLGTGAALVFFRYAPFPLLQRLLFCFGYYLLYEYTVIARAHALQLLLAFAALTLFARRRRIGAAEALLLVLLANTNLYGLIAAGQILLLALLYEGPLRFVRRAWNEPRAALAPLAVLAGAALSFGQIFVQAMAMGPDHIGAYRPGYDLQWVLSGLSAVAHGFLPLQDPTTIHSWNSSILDLLPAPLALASGAALGAACLLLGAWALRRHAAVLSVFLLGAGSMLAATLFFWHGYTRHHGQFFLWLICCLWLARTPAPGAPSGQARSPLRGWSPPLSALLGALLLAQALACAWAVAQDLRRPFSQSRAAGLLLRGAEFEDAILVGSVDYAVQPIAAYIDRPIWYPESGRFGTFMDWSARRRLVPVEAALQDALDLFEGEGRDVVLVLNHTPRLGLGQRLALGQDGELTYFAAFTGAIVPDENYHLYRLERRRPPP